LVEQTEQTRNVVRANSQPRHPLSAARRQGRHKPLRSRQFQRHAIAPGL